MAHMKTQTFKIDAKKICSQVFASFFSSFSNQGGNFFPSHAKHGKLFSFPHAIKNKKPFSLEN